MQRAPDSASGPTQELEALVAATRQGQPVLARLPQLLATVRALLADLEAAGRGEEAQPAQAARQHGLLLAFRAARNAAATGGPPAVAALLHEGLLDAVHTTLALVSDATIALDWQLPAAVAQALANLCTASGEGAAAAWAALFPLQLTMLAHVNAGATQAATCLVLLACCRAVEGAAAALAGADGSQAMAALLCNHQRMLQQGEHSDNLCLLAAHLAFRHNLLPALFDSLGASCTGGGRDVQLSGALAVGSAAAEPTMAQVALLEALCAEAHEMPQLEPAAAAAGATPGSEQPGAAAQFLVNLAQQLAALSKAAPLSAGQQQMLQACLHLQRDLCARDDSGAGLPGGGNLVEQLQAAGFLPATLAMLKALQPIQNPQRAAAAAGGAGASSTPDGSGSQRGIPVAQLAPQLAARAAVFSAVPPYPGFRSDLLSVVANAAHGRPGVQAEVQALGGVELVLAQCQLDRNSPLAREWALWAVRNLCEGNPAAQEAIRELQLCTTVDNEELQRLGVKLELDDHTGKLRVTKREDSGVPA